MTRQQRDETLEVINTAHSYERPSAGWTNAAITRKINNDEQLTPAEQDEVTAALKRDDNMTDILEDHAPKVRELLANWETLR